MKKTSDGRIYDVNEQMDVEIEILSRVEIQKIFVKMK